MLLPFPPLFFFFFLLLFPIPHIWVIARPYCLLCFVVVLYSLFLKNFTLFHRSVDRPANHTGNLHRLRNVNNKQLTVNNFSSALIKTQLKTKRLSKESHVISFSYHCHCQIVYRKSFLIASLEIIKNRLSNVFTDPLRKWALSPRPNS